jgi:Putative transposase/Transposase zinc-binding domain
MVELAEIVRIHGPEYLEKFGDRMPASHKRALAAIVCCRTEAMGGHLEECDDSDCAHHRYAYHSCKNRNCPKCHTADTKRWLAKRRKELLHVPYFHVTCTLPQGLRRIVRGNQKKLYAILMGTAADALAKLGLDPNYVGGQLAILAVLHTWTRTLGDHPHVHMLVSAGGLDKNGDWRPARNKKYLVCEKALSKIFRARFMARARKALPKESFSQELWQTDWVVKIKPPIKNPNKVLDYLGRYVHRIAIANSRILSLKDGLVTFRYQESDSRQWKTMTLQAMEFLRRYLQHVLPDGFHKVRYFGLWSPANRKKKLKKAQLHLAAQGKTIEEDKGEAPATRPDRLCPCCKKGVMVMIDIIAPRGRSPPWAGMKGAAGQ